MLSLSVHTGQWSKKETQFSKNPLNQWENGKGVTLQTKDWLIAIFVYWLYLIEILIYF